jgi:hypothetical protein
MRPGSPDRVNRTQLNVLATPAGFTTDESWSGALVKTFNYNKPQ